MMKKVPKRRFKGFLNAGDWEQRKLGECVDISTGYPFDSQDFNENGEYLVITNGNIQENTPFVLNNVGNRIDLDDSLKKYILDIDDLLITMDGTVGRVAIVVDNKLVLAQRVCRIKSNEPYYIYQLLSKNDFIRSMNKIGHGGTIKHISLSEISEYQAFYPKSQKERIKISSVLTNYDELITLHQRKLEKLQATKKALLYELFPIENSRRPKRRFKGFTGDWEQRKLGELVTVFSGRDYKHLSEGDIPVYGTGGYMLSVNEALSNDQDAIGIGRKGTIDKPYILKAPFWTVDTLFYAIPKEKMDLNFIFCIFKNVDWRKLDESTGVPSLSKSTITNVDVYCPFFEEQLLIGRFFSWIDSSITLHQRKLEKLKNLKAAYLNEMFV